jgi:hypothetical protein
LEEMRPRTEWIPENAKKKTKVYTLGILR